MTQIHKIRPSADRLVEWSDEEMQQMRAAVAACDGFIESRWPGEQPCYSEDTDTRPMRHTRRWYYDNVATQQDEPQPPAPNPQTQLVRKKRKYAHGVLKEHDAELRKMCADPTMTCEKIGKHFDVDTSTVAKYTRQHGIERAWIKTARGCSQLTMDAHREDIRQWLREGAKQEWMAVQLGVPRTSLCTYIHCKLNM